MVVMCYETKVNVFSKIIGKLVQIRMYDADAKIDTLVYGKVKSIRNTYEGYVQSFVFEEAFTMISGPNMHTVTVHDTPVVRTDLPADKYRIISKDELSELVEEYPLYVASKMEGSL